MDVLTTCLRVVWLLAGLVAFSVRADIGPAFTGITAAANDATSTFWSPAGITRLKEPELLVQGRFITYGCWPVVPQPD